MLDLDGRIVGDFGKFGVQRLHDAERVRGSIEKIGISEGYVLRAPFHLLPDIGEHHLALHHAEPALIDRYDGAVPAEVFAATARLRVGDLLAFLTVPQAGITAGAG